MRLPQGHSTMNRSSFTGIISTSTCCGAPGRLTGVVDWPHAAVGSRGSDVGHCRLNLAVLFDAETADDYLARYERAADARWTGGPTYAHCSASTSIGNASSHSKSPDALRSMSLACRRVASAVRHALDEIG